MVAVILYFVLSLRVEFQYRTTVLDHVFSQYYISVFKVRHHIKCIYLQPPNRSMVLEGEEEDKEEEEEEGEEEEREEEKLYLY